MKATIKNYLHLSKPGIILGNLIPACAGFFLASQGNIRAPLLMATLVGISLVVASACVLNNCIDRNMDRKMARTRNRVMARGLISLRSRRFLRRSAGHGRHLASLMGDPALVRLGGGVGVCDVCGRVQPLSEAPFRIRRPAGQSGRRGPAPLPGIVRSQAAWIQGRCSCF